MHKFFDILLINGIITIFGLIIFGSQQVHKHRMAMVAEFPKGSPVKVLNSDIVGKVQYVDSPYVSVLYVDDLNVVHEITVSPEFLTKVK